MRARSGSSNALGRRHEGRRLRRPWACRPSARRCSQGGHALRPIEAIQRKPLIFLVVSLATVIGTGRGAGSQPAEYAPTIDPADFSTNIDNPFLPFQPGTRWVYEGPDDTGQIEHREVLVTAETKEVMGVTCIVVRDTVTVNGRLVEDTNDWYAQHKDGTVWYFGEDTTEYTAGLVASNAGSWEAGKNGAQPGIVMKGSPRVGDRYYNEYHKGEAEDQSEVISLSEKVTVPAGTYDGVLQTKDWTDLEPGVLEHKHYARGIGAIKEEHIEGGSERHELIEMTRREAPAAEPSPIPG